MDQIVSQIATTGNLAVLVLMVVCGGLYKMLREERVLERESRREDVQHCVEATNRQTEAVIELTKALTELRLDAAKK